LADALADVLQQLICLGGQFSGVVLTVCHVFQQKLKAVYPLEHVHCFVEVAFALMVCLDVDLEDLHCLQDDMVILRLVRDGVD
jgi:hypothetical protein